VKIHHTAERNGACPSREKWSDFLLGLSSDQDQASLVAHLANCPACLGTLDGIQDTKDEVIVAVRKSLLDGSGEVMIAYDRFLRGVMALSPPLGLVEKVSQPEYPRRIGRFEIVEQLGVGGFGRVFLAHDPRLQRQVALKVPLDRWALGGTLRDRIATEGIAASRLDHPNIVPVYEAGEVDGIPYIASKYCSGPTLGEWLRLRPVFLTHDLAAHLLLMLAAAVGHAHEKGVLHRDIKPSNVLLDAVSEPAVRDPLGIGFVPRLTDFGLAKILANDEERSKNALTGDGAALGTAEYMAPEQAIGRTSDADVRTDVYALGVLLYELLTGRVPFKGETRGATLRQIERDDPIPPNLLRPGLPRDLDTICLMCLEKAPARRYATASELEADLRSFLAGEPIKARPPGPMERAWRSTKKRPVVSSLCAATLLAASLIGILQLQHSRALSQNLRQLQTKERTLRQRLYASEINQAWRALQAGRMQEARGRLERLKPAETGDPVDDPRGFEWYYLRGITETRKELRVIHAHTGIGGSLEFGPKGRLLATGGADDHLVKLWDSDTGNVRAILSGHVGDVNRVTFSPNGNFLASAGDDKTVRVWDVHRKETRFILGEHSDRVLFVAFAPDGQLLASAGKNSEVFLWDAVTGMRIGSFVVDSPVRAIGFAPAGRRLVTAHFDGKVSVWDLTKNPINLDTLKPITIESSISSMISDLAISLNGERIAVSGSDGALSFINLREGKLVNHLRRFTERVNCLAYSFDGHYVASGDEAGELRIWSPEGAELAVLHLSDERASALAFSPEGELASLSQDGTVRFWNWKGQDNDHLAIRTGPWRAQSPAISIVADRSMIVATAPDGLFRLFELPGGREVFWASPGQDSCPPMAVSPDGTLLASSLGNGEIEVWSLTDHSMRGRFRAFETSSWIIPLAFSPDGKVLATCKHSESTDLNIDLWDWTEGRKVFTFVGHSKPILAAAFSRDGRLLVTGSSGERSVIIWDLQSKRLRTILHGQTESVSAISFSPDNKSFATASHDRTVKLWDLATGEHHATLRNDSAWVRSVAFSPDGKTLVSGDYIGTITFWHVPTSQELFRATRVHRGAVETIAFATDNHLLVTAAGQAGELTEVIPWNTTPTKYVEPSIQSALSAPPLSASPK
jgi:WD40 repeat protein/serine/threonine protein kinase